MYSMEIKALKTAIDIAGGQTALAEQIGKTQGHISKWLEREYIPAESVLDIEQATGVSRHILRPDLYPLATGAAAFLVNEDLIKFEHEKFIENSVVLRIHLAFLNGVLDSIDRYVRADAHANESDLVYLRLLIICFNNVSAAITLAVRGYWQPSLSLARDVVETGELLELFALDQLALADWIQLTGKDRWKKFSPKKVRDRLSERDGHTLQRREENYSLLSEFAAHPSPEGFVVIAIDDLTQVGPFPSDTKLLAVLQELARHCDQLSRTIWQRPESLSGSKKKICDAWAVHSANWLGALKTF